MTKKLEPYQQRVVDEYDELLIKHDALELFISSNDEFKKLDCDEQSRLELQKKYMTSYAIILSERIIAFAS